MYEKIAIEVFLEMGKVNYDSIYFLTKYIFKFFKNQRDEQICDWLNELTVTHAQLI